MWLPILAEPDEFRTPTWIEVPWALALAFVASLLVLFAWASYEVIQCRARRRARGRPGGPNPADHVSTMRALRRPGRLGPTMTWVGVPLALTTVVGAFGLIWASGEDGRIYVRMGFAGLVAVGLLWAARARTGTRAALRACGVSAAIALGSGVVVIAAVLASEAGTFAGAEFNAIVATGARGGEFGPVDEYRFVSLAITVQTALNWVLNMVGLLVAVAIAPALRRRINGTDDGGSLLVRLAVPFGLLTVAALVDGALTAALIALLAAGWLALAVATAGR